MDVAIQNLENLLQRIRGFRQAEPDVKAATAAMVTRVPESAQQDVAVNLYDQWEREIDVTLTNLKDEAKKHVSFHKKPQQSIAEKIRRFNVPAIERKSELQKETPLQLYSDAITLANDTNALKEFLKAETKTLKSARASKILKDLEANASLSIGDAVVDEIRELTESSTAGLLTSKSAMRAKEQILSIPPELEKLFVPHPSQFNSPQEDDHLPDHITIRFKISPNDLWFHPSILPAPPQSLGYIKGNLNRGQFEGILKHLHSINFSTLQRTLVLLQWFITSASDDPASTPWITSKVAMEMAMEVYWGVLHLHQKVNTARATNQLVGGESKTVGAANSFIRNKTDKFKYCSDDQLKKLQTFKPRENKNPSEGGRGKPERGSKPGGKPK